MKKQERIPRAGLNLDGSEVVDPNPVAIAAGLNRPPTLEQTIARVLRNQQNLQMLSKLDIEETAEEAEDFSIDGVEQPTRFERAAEQVPISVLKARLLRSLAEKPTLFGYIRDKFAHVFKPGELKEPAPPKPVDKEAPKE